MPLIFGKWTKVGIPTPFPDKVGGGKMQTSSPPVITPNRSQSDPDDMITLPRPIQSVGMDLHDVSGTSTGQTLPRERRAPPGTHFCPTIWWVYPHLLLFLSSTHYCPLFHPLLSEIYPLLTTLRPSKGGLKRQSLLQTWCGSAPRRGPSANGYDACAAAAADLVWVWAPPRTIRKWVRRLAFWILRTRAQDPCSCCCRPGVGLRPAADHPQMVTTPGVLDPADPGARSLQLLFDISDKSG